jgi:RNA polymerase-binding protein DksA
MRTADLESHRDTLVDMRARLTDEVGDMIQRVPEQANLPGELSNVPTHLADHDSEGLESAVELIRNERDMLEMVEAALARIEDGTYGICERCGQQIAEPRLQAIPYTPHCIQCASKLERLAERRQQRIAS